MKNYMNTLVYDISYKTFIGAKYCVLGSINYMDSLAFIMKLDI